MSKHTPGPWKAIECSVRFPNRQGGFDIRNCPNPEANARLIAAAPDLLEALKGLVDLAHEAGFPCDKADAAIARATEGK